MTLSELKRKVDFLNNQGHGDDVVLITLQERFVGARASAEIVDISAGFDLERGQVRLHTDKRIISYENDRDNIIQVL